jgi:dTDP-4-amino-4,6-dideoxygalactose transaminase
MSNIRLSKSSVGQEEKDAVCRVIEAGYLGMGKEVQLFEEEITAYLGTDLEVICVNTGTAALHLALLCLDIGPGDEVLVPSITYVASFQAIAATGAKPIACDVTVDRVFIDLEDAKKRLTKRTKAIMPVHWASNSQDMDAVYDFAGAHGLRVVEDAAQAFGCVRNGAKVGTVGDTICFSFDGIKNITSGEGGCVITGDKELARRIKDARLLGVEKDTEKRYQGQRSWSFDVNHQGFRYHMSNLMAAIGREQLKKLARFGDHRKELVEHYCNDFSSNKSIEIFDFNYTSIISHIFPIRVINGMRDNLMTYLQGQGIECGIHYQANHKLKLFSTDYSLPVAELLGEQLLSLPLHADLTEVERKHVSSNVLGFLNILN